MRFSNIIQIIYAFFEVLGEIFPNRFVFEVFGEIFPNRFVFEVFGEIFPNCFASGFWAIANVFS